MLLLFYFILFYFIYAVFQDISVGIANSLRAERSGYRIPVRARFSTYVQTGPGTHLASYTMDIVSFLGVK
jgi:hypothetical protein